MYIYDYAALENLFNDVLQNTGFTACFEDDQIKLIHKNDELSQIMDDSVLEMHSSLCNDLVIDDFMKLIGKYAQQRNTESLILLSKALSAIQEK